MNNRNLIVAIVGIILFFLGWRDIINFELFTIINGGDQPLTLNATTLGILLIAIGLAGKFIGMLSVFIFVGWIAWLLLFEQSLGLQDFIAPSLLLFFGVTSYFLGGMVGGNEYYCDLCGQYLGTRPKTCDGCGHNVYRTKNIFE